MRSNGSTLILTDYDVRALLPVAACIDVMADALAEVARGTSTLPLRTVLRLAGTSNVFASMPAVHGAGAHGSIGAKVITVFPGNQDTPYDSHIGAVLLFDAEHGRLLAIADASSITAIRTAAVSGLATRLLARHDAAELALLGAGVLAVPHIEAMCAVRSIARVRLWSRSESRVQRLAAKLHLPGIEIIVADSAKSAVLNADIVCTITSARTPVLEGHWLAPGTHVNAVGASVRDARELDTEAVQRSRMFVDRRESTLAEAGDFLIPRAAGEIDDAHIVAELGELLLGTATGRQNAAEITLFKSLGLAVEDVAALRYIYNSALERNAGTMVRLGGMRDES